MQHVHILSIHAVAMHAVVHKTDERMLLAMDLSKQVLLSFHCMRLQ